MEKDGDKLCRPNKVSWTIFVSVLCQGRVRGSCLVCICVCVLKGSVSKRCLNSN